MDDSFLTFLGVSIVVIVAPGPDTALTIRNTFRGGRTSGVWTALGVSAGQLIWAVATSVGLVAVLLASEPVFRAVRLAGGAYLIWLGVQSLRAAFGARGPWPPAESVSRPRGSTAAFVQGLVNNLGNPKMAVFAWLAVYAIVLSTAGRLLRARRAQRAIEAVSGTVLIGLGARVAVDAR